MRIFRKYHRLIAVTASLPLLLTVITGVGYTIFDEWLHLDKIGGFLMQLHTLKILGLDEIYPVLNGIALIGLLVTGLSMTSLFKQRPQPKYVGDR
ncbi:peptidase [Capilliphycus salinus ALCB114379]|uniref:peptidase n=1 Tax=Capilliphycus salinus TaxID=2768948 RepID=UPI0039A5390E